MKILDNSFVGGLVSLVLIGVLIWGLVKYGLKGMLGLLILCCIIAAIAYNPGYLKEFGGMILDTIKLLIKG
jgi:hypothetical protein